MATAQTTPRSKSRANGNDTKAVAARASRNEARQDLQNAQEAAGNFVSAVRASATHFGQHLRQKVTHTAASAANEAQTVRYKAEDRVRERPLAAIGVAAGIGLLLGILTRR